MNSRHGTKDQIIRMLYSIVFFIVLTGAAVGLDLLSQWVSSLGVSRYTYMLVAFSAHVMLTLDVVLFLVALCFSAWDYIQELRQ